MDQRVTYLWSIFREEVRNGFKRRSIEKTDVLIKIRFFLILYLIEQREMYNTNFICRLRRVEIYLLII